MSHESDVEKIVKATMHYGWRHRLTERGHHQWLSPNGEDIVHHSGTTGDVRSWNALKSQFRRAGFDVDTMQPCDKPGGHAGNGLGGGATTSLGEKLAELLPKAQEPVDGSKVSVRQILRDYFAQHPGETINAAVMTEMVKGLRPDLTPNNTSMTLSKMVERSELVRVKMGWYRAATDEDRRRIAIGLEPTPDGKPKPALVALPGDGPATAEQKFTEAVGHAKETILKPLADALSGVAKPQAAESTGDEQIDAELRELDSAVTQIVDGFATLETLLRRHRETLKMLAKVKKMLGGLS